MESQSIIVELQVVLPRVESEDPAKLERLAVEYAQLCEDANTRLSNAVNYLRRQYRSEAIRICKEEPMLLAEVNALNFSQRRDWLHVAQQLHVTTPDLLLSLATELSEAFEAHDTVRELTEQYRAENIRGASREQRRQTLEALIAAEPSNGVWRDNLRDLERD